MKYPSLLSIATTLFFTSYANAEGRQQPTKIYHDNAREIVEQVAPALNGYNLKYVHQELWQRPELSMRDRSLITLASLITRNDTTELPFYAEIALDNGVKASEISEIITHLAFYAGRSNAYTAAVTLQPVFKKHGITTKDLPTYEVKSLPIDQKAEAAREAQVSANFETVSPGVLYFTTDMLFNDLWLRPGLQPRDRSLITISSLITSGNVEQIPYHLNRAMDSGLSKAEASETLTQLAFYAGWPNTFAAMPFFKDVFTKRQLK